MLYIYTYILCLCKYYIHTYIHIERYIHYKLIAKYRINIENNQWIVCLDRVESLDLRGMPLRDENHMAVYCCLLLAMSYTISFIWVSAHSEPYNTTQTIIKGGILIDPNQYTLYLFKFKWILLTQTTSFRKWQCQTSRITLILNENFLISF